MTPPQGVGAMPGSLLGPGAAARLAAAHPGSPAATKQISFQICWYLHYRSRSSQEYAWELFFSYLQREVFDAPVRQLLCSLHRRGIHNTSGNHL